MSEEVVLDARGRRCPFPVIELGRTAREAPDGLVIVVLATDPAAEPDVAAWCRMRGHDLLAQGWDEDRTTLTSRVRIRRTTAAAVPAAPLRAGPGTSPG